MHWFCKIRNLKSKNTLIFDNIQESKFKGTYLE